MWSIKVAVVSLVTGGGGDIGVVVQVVVVDDGDQSLNSWHCWNDWGVSIVTCDDHSHSDLAVVELVIATNLVVVGMLLFVMLHWNHDDDAAAAAVSVRVVYLHW